jgi:hypothetical protein
MSLCPMARGTRHSLTLSNKEHVSSNFRTKLMTQLFTQHHEHRLHRVCNLFAFARFPVNIKVFAVTPSVLYCRTSSSESCESKLQTLLQAHVQTWGKTALQFQEIKPIPARVQLHFNAIQMCLKKAQISSLSLRLYLCFGHVTCSSCIYIK